MNKTIKTLLIFAAAALILFLMYAFFLQPAPANQGAVTGGLITVSTQADGSSDSADIVGLLAQMRSLQLDRSLFAGQLYQSLHDFGVNIAPEPYGKDDPFASIDAAAQAVDAAPAADSAAVPKITVSSRRPAAAQAQ